MRSLIVLSIRLKQPLAVLMELSDEVLVTYFEVLNESDKEARGGK